MSLDTILKIMVPLVGDKVACPVSKGREVHLFFITLADLHKHLGLHHVDARIQWECLHCDKSFLKLHGAKYKCEACPMSFGTQRGPSTHERRAHPVVRNVKRRGTEPLNRNWTVEEATLLRGLEETYKNHKYPNKEISKILTTRRIGQIK